MAEPEPLPGRSSYEHAVAVLASAAHLPRMAAFALNDTLWPAGEESAGLFPGSETMLSALHSRGIALAVAARSTHPSKDSLRLARIGAGPPFVAKVLKPASCSAGDVLRALKQQAGIPLGRLVYFDADVLAIREASRMGVTAVRVSKGGLTVDHVRQCVTAFQAPSLRTKVFRRVAHLFAS